MAQSIYYTGIARPYVLGKYSVEENSKKLLRYSYFHQRLFFLLCGLLPDREDWELRQGIARNIFEHAEAANDLRIRILDLRTSATKLGKFTDPLMELFFDELQHARNDLEIATALYAYIIPSWITVYENHIEETQQIVDQPTIRTLKRIVAELKDQLSWGKLMVSHLESKAQFQSEEVKSQLSAFINDLKFIEQAAGGFDGQKPKTGKVIEKKRSIDPFIITRRSKRDPSMGEIVHFRTSMGLHYESEDHQLLVDMMRVRQEEMAAVDLLAKIIFLQRDMSWEFYHDLARHLWDEARHSMFGQAALEAEGYDWRSRPQYTASYDLFHDRPTQVQYAFLSIGVEDAQMKRPGKIAEFEFCRDKMQHPLMTQFQDYDWTDEVNHAKFGRKWSPELMNEDLQTIRASMKNEVEDFFEKTGLTIKKIAFSDSLLERDDH
jgi:hypothetical protein